MVSGKLLKCSRFRLPCVLELPTLGSRGPSTPPLKVPTHLHKATQQEVVPDTDKVLFSAFTQEERPGSLKKDEREKDYEFDEFQGPILLHSK